MKRFALTAFASVLVISGLVMGSSPVGAQAVLPDCSTVAGNLVQDCGFEQPSLGTMANLINTTTGARFPDPTTGPWISGAGGFWIKNNAANGGWNPDNGNQSVNLNTTLGGSSLSQAIPTQPGHIYLVTFALAGVPNGLFPCAGLPGSFIKTLNVSFDSFGFSFSFDASGSEPDQHALDRDHPGPGPLAKLGDNDPTGVPEHDERTVRPGDR